METNKENISKHDNQKSKLHLDGNIFKEKFNPKKKEFFHPKREKDIKQTHHRDSSQDHQIQSQFNHFELEKMLRKNQIKNNRTLLGFNIP